MRKRITLLAFGAVLVVSFAIPGLSGEWYDRPAVGFHEGGVHGRITKLGGIDRDDFPEPPDHVDVLINWEVELQATRASGDMDTWNPLECGSPESLHADSLREGWPRWYCSSGTWKNDNQWGTTVIWITPDEEKVDVTVRLFEDDNRAWEPPDPPDPRNDGGDDGVAQDVIAVDVIKLDVELTISTEGNVTNGTSGPNSLNYLGLWSTVKTDELVEWRGKEPWAYWTTGWTDSPPSGEYTNGTESFTDMAHEMAIGTCLRTEIWARHRKQGLPERIRAAANRWDNWRFVQKKRGEFLFNGGQSQPECFILTSWTHDFTADSGSSIAAFDVDRNPETPIDSLHCGDAPGLAEHREGFGMEGNTWTKDMDYVTWVEFNYMGYWGRVTEVPGDDPDFDPMWGWSGELKMGSSAWSIEKPATAKQYD